MPVTIFICYAHEDEVLLKKLKTHLRPLERQGLIDLWHDRNISAGTEWEQEINQHLNTAQMILLLVSPDFMASDYCYGIEMKRALERHQRGEARVIPIILRHVYWRGILGNLQALPTDAKPVRSWADVDEALFDVTESIRKVVVQLGLQKAFSPMAGIPGELLRPMKRTAPKRWCKLKSPGIPGELLRPMKKALEECPEFENNTQLKAVFNSELLVPWRGYVREADTTIGRVDLVIDRLIREKRAETRTNALFLFLLVLRDRTDPRNDRYNQLGNLARDFNNSLQSSTSPNTPYSSEEANPGNQPMLFVEDFKALLESVQSVGKVSVPQMNNGNMTGHQSSGTGWLIAPGLALTCLHVIEARTSLDGKIRDADREDQAIQSVLTFDYTAAGTGIGYQVRKLECYDSALDYALVRLQDRIDYPLHKQGFLSRDVEAPLIQNTSGFYIIQHPKGQPQQVASGFYQQHLQDQKDRILHSAPTEKGTSGAPVLNTQNWSVVALHTSDNPTYRLREATLLGAILSHIQQTKTRVYDEIKHAASER